MGSPRPRLCFIGPMVAKYNRATPQVELIANLFEDCGYPVISVSSKQSRLGRLLDIVLTLIQKRNAIDVMHINTFGRLSFVFADIASWLGRWFGHKVALHLHAGDFPDFMARFPRWSKRVLSRAHVIIAPTFYLARAVGAYGLQAQVIPNFVCLTDYPYRQRETVEPRLFWMRTFHPIYNPKMALRVLRKLRESFPKATLVMAGEDKGMKDALLEEAKKLGLEDAVRWPGFLDMQGKMREADAADIYVNTTRIDNTPVSVIEACALGLPVVTTDVGGIPYLLTDGETALLVPDNDDEKMVQAIQRLLNELGLAAHLSANGRKLAEACSWDVVRPQWEHLFANLMNGSQGKK